MLALGDNASYSAVVAAAPHDETDVTLFARSRATQAAQLPPAVVARHTHCRQDIETVNEQLIDQRHVEVHYAKPFWGLYARLPSKLTADHAVSISTDCLAARLLAEQGGSLRQLAQRPLAHPCYAGNAGACL